MPVAIVGMTFLYKYKRLQLVKGSPALPPAQWEKEKRELEARIQNLEDIIIATDSQRLAAAAPQARLPSSRS
jgi:hypothetical protein